MAETLSLSASIIAIPGADGAVATGILKIQRIRHAVDESLAFNDEISDLCLADPFLRYSVLRSNHP